jgi:hypothetical protein
MNGGSASAIGRGLFRCGVQSYGRPGRPNVMLDINPGGGVTDAVREAQALVRPRAVL